jgi:uncharacterized membrane protein
MDIDNRKVLIAIVAITLLSLPVVLFTTGPPRIVLGLLFVLFFPGYALISALFPRRGSLSGIERIALSIGLSIAVVPLIGLVLNYTPWGIRLYPILVSATLFIVVASAVGWYRQWRLPPKERFGVSVGVRQPKRRQRRGIGDKVLYACLGLAVVVAIGSLCYVIAVPKQGERFTEFYILGAEGQAENYPKVVVVNEPVALTLGVVNHESQTLSYRIDIVIGGVEQKEVTTGELASEEKWESEISFTPQSLGKGQKVEFWLYKDAETEPYFKDPLHLYIDVLEPYNWGG